MSDNVKFRRLIDDAKIDNFCYTLSQTDWSELYPIEDVSSKGRPKLTQK